MIFPGLGQVSYKKFIQITLAGALAGGARCCWIIIITNVGDRTESHTFTWKALKESKMQKLFLNNGKNYKIKLIAVVTSCWTMCSGRIKDTQC